VIKFATDVVAFNRDILGIDRRTKSLLEAAELDQTTKCLREEIDELERAHQNTDFIEGVDALIDLVYFAIGGLYRMGLSPEEIAQCAEIIHNCNMRKEKGVVWRRGDGSAADATKPSGWKGPEELMAVVLGGNL
jgi:predicted HAD superfamily Cof-like phosphohydrolase